MNIHQQYAKQYNCTIAQSICDRDWPMNERECIAAFVEAEGRKPTEEEIRVMRPDSNRRVVDLRAEFDAEFDDRPR